MGILGEKSMTTATLAVQYCDEIIRHAGELKYSLIGVRPGFYLIPEKTAVIPQLCLCITYHIPITCQGFVPGARIHIDILRNKTEVTWTLDMVPEASENTEGHDSLNGVLMQTMLNFPVSNQDLIHARLRVGDNVLIESNQPLKIMDMQSFADESPTLKPTSF